MRAEPPARRARRWPKAVATVGVMGAVGVGAYLLGQQDTTEEPQATTTTSTPSTTEGTGATGGDVVAFEDAATGISFDYPEEWEPIELAEDADPSIVVILSAGGEDSVLVRTVPLAEAVTADNLADLNSVTDGIIGDSSVSVLAEEEVEINGMPGYYYLYLFDDEATGEQGVHEHYFLFKDKTMNVIVFQAVPTAQFDVLAPTFADILSSFEANPPAAPAETTTTAGG